MSTNYILIMNINDLPQELILEIFSYLPQHDLVTLYCSVSDLWTQISLCSKFWSRVKFTDVYDSHLFCYEHFKIIKTFVYSLVINENQLGEFFDRHSDFDTNLPNLRILDVTSISTKKLADRIVSRCPQLENLKISEGIQLDVHNCCESFSKLSLVSFYIHYFDSNTEENGSDLVRFIQSQHRLRKFGIRAFPYINETVKQMINEAQTLKSLYISECVSDGAFYEITKQLSLEELIIHSDRVSDDGLDFITKFTKQLKILDVRLCTEITDSGIRCVVKNCPLLEKISVGKVFPKRQAFISNASLNSLSQGCPNLTYLSATGCILIEDDGITSITSTCKNLQVIILKGCSEITDKSVYALSTCLSLRKLDLTGCIKISLTAVIHLINVRQKLKTLILAFCYGIGNNNEKENNDSNVEDIKKGKKKRISKSQTKIKPEYSANIEKVKCFKINSESFVEEVSLKGSKNISKTDVLMLVKHCPVITRLTLPNNTKMETDEQFIRSLFSLCTYLNRFFIFGRTIERHRYI